MEEEAELAEKINELLGAVAALKARAPSRCRRC